MLNHLTRRTLLAAIPAATAGFVLSDATRSRAAALGLPVGVQLYSVRDLLPHDFAGTLKQIAAIGYKEVEAAGYYNHSANDVKAALEAAGLRCPSAHYSYQALAAGFDSIVDFNSKVGVHTIICSFPGFKDPARVKGLAPGSMLKAFNMDDWHWNAEQFNKFGKRAKDAGMAFGYHNHIMEFHSDNGVTGLDALIRNTDPDLVTFELDCGWVVVGGGNPVDYLKRYSSRISMLHVKDFRKATQPASLEHPPQAAELGTGTIDYHPIFAAAKEGHITHLFVEQEEFNMPPMQSLRIDYNYVNDFAA